MSRPRTRDFGALAGQQVQRDVAAAAKAPDRFERAQVALSGPPTLLDLDAILPREKSTREIREGDVLTLAESIAVLGLIEPIVVDAARRLLAGGHRLAAIRWLRDHRHDAFVRWFSNGVSVRGMDFDADADPDRALAVEIAENEHRRDYTAREVRDLVSRLREAGYREAVGRPRAGEKALGPALEAVVGKSIKTIRKLLSEGESERSLRGPAQPPLVSTIRALSKQRASIPPRWLETFDALVAGLEQELQQRQELELQ